MSKEGPGGSRPCCCESGTDLEIETSLSQRAGRKSVEVLRSPIEGCGSFGRLMGLCSVPKLPSKSLQ